LPVSAQVPDLSAAQARTLFSAGWRDPAALALAEPGDVAKALVATLPNSMRGGKRSANGKTKTKDVRRVNPDLVLQSCSRMWRSSTCTGSGTSMLHLAAAVCTDVEASAAMGIAAA